MASEKDKPTRGDIPESQDQSIKSRKTQLFEDEPLDGNLATQSFAQYLKTTPPAPLAPWFNIALWALGVVVLLLFLAAIFSGRHGTPRRKASERPASASPQELALSDRVSTKFSHSTSTWNETPLFPRSHGSRLCDGASELESRVGRVSGAVL
jgi:hypothetical protein